MNDSSGTGGASSPSGGQKKTLTQRLDAVQLHPQNGYCSECQAKKPRWAVLLHDTDNRDGVLGLPCQQLKIDSETVLGMLVCISCSNVFKTLGAKSVQVVTVKALNHEQTVALEIGGNKVVNAIFEGKLTFDVDRPVAESDTNVREAYIKSKYIDRTWLHPSAARSVIAAAVASSSTNSSVLLSATKGIALRASKIDSLSKSNHGPRPSRNSNNKSRDVLSTSFHGTSSRHGGVVTGRKVATGGKLSPKKPVSSRRKNLRRSNSANLSSSNHSNRSSSNRSTNRSSSGRNSPSVNKSYDIDFEDDSSSSDSGDDFGGDGGSDSKMDDELTRDLKDLKSKSSSGRRRGERTSRSARGTTAAPKDTGTTKDGNTEEKKMFDSFDKMCFGTSSDDDGFFPDDPGYHNNTFGADDDPFGDSFDGGSFGDDDDDDGGGTDAIDAWWDPTTKRSPTKMEENQVELGVTNEPIKDRSTTDNVDQPRKYPRSQSIGNGSSRRLKSQSDAMPIPVPQRRQGDALGSSRHRSLGDMDVSRSRRGELDVSRSGSGSLRRVEGSPKRSSSARGLRHSSRQTSKTRTLSEQLSRDKSMLDDDGDEEESKSARSAGGKQRSSSRSKPRRVTSSASVRSAPTLQDEQGNGERRAARRKDVLRSSHHSGKSLRTASAHSTSLSSHGSSVDISSVDMSDDSFGNEFDASQQIHVTDDDNAQQKPSSRRRMRRDELTGSSGHHGRRRTMASSPEKHSSNGPPARSRSRSSNQISRSSRPSSYRSKPRSFTEKTDAACDSGDLKEDAPPAKTTSITQLALAGLYSE